MLDLTNTNIDGSDPTNFIVKVEKISENLEEISKKGQNVKKSEISSNIISKSSEVTETSEKSLDERNLVEILAKNNLPKNIATDFFNKY
jgi:hypothetical protein